MTLEEAVKTLRESHVEMEANAGYVCSCSHECPCPERAAIDAVLAALEERTRERDKAKSKLDQVVVLMNESAAKLNEQLGEAAFFHRRADEAEARVAALEADIAWQEERNRNNVMAYSDRVAALEAALHRLLALCPLCSTGSPCSDPRCQPVLLVLGKPAPYAREERARVQPAQGREEGERG